MPTIAETKEDKPVIELPSIDELDLNTPVPPVDEVPLEEINLADGRLFVEDKCWEYFDRLRVEDPVHLNETDFSGRYWSLTRYDDIKAVDTNDALFSSASGIVLGQRTDARLPEDNLSALNLPMFISMDDPDHASQRRTVAPIVGPKSLMQMEPLIRERAADILDNLPTGETFNWVDKVSIELTTRMLATLFDFPYEERRKLTWWSDVATTQPGLGLIDSEEERAEIMMECVGYFANLWEERKANPGHDLISLLVHGESTRDKGVFDHLGNLLLLIVGGNDTTRNSISGGVLALNRFPEQYEKLRGDLTLIPNMVAEIIRWQTPLAHMRRTANEDCEIRGKAIRAGEQVLMWYAAGNRDPEVFERPHEFIIDRPNARAHLSFGFGVHRCMGNRLAEMQLRIIWEEIMKRFRFIEVVGEPKRPISAFVRGYTELPVVVHRR